MKSKQIHMILLAMVMLLGSTSCKDYLDLKPDKSRVLPKTLVDAQALLDNYDVMNVGYPGEAEAAADNYFLPDANSNALTINDRNNYIWEAKGDHALAQWINPYKVVFNANLALQVLDDLPNTGTDYNTIKGSALFFRAFAFYQVAQLFAQPYDKVTATTNPGIPLRLSPDVDIKSERGSVQQTYDRILTDLQEAVQLLPVTVIVKSRPTKAAAYAMLARTYLTMQDYANAGKMADESLKLYNTLVDYKTLTAPITRFSTEILFHAEAISTQPLTPSAAKIDQALYDTYEINDKRKTLLFSTNADNSHAFNGSYTGITNAIIFNGIATDEVYLIRAECYAREGNLSAALADLNTLLRNRYDATFTDKIAASADNALNLILLERRKELIMRGLRWTDLRRLNKEPRFAITLTRVVNGVTYTLPPNDLRYTLLIHKDVINSTNLNQNQR